MKSWWRRRARAFSFGAVLAFAVMQSTGSPGLLAQRGPNGPPQRGEEEVKLPNGKSQRDEILKSEHEQNIKDAAQLAQLAEELKEDLEKNDRFVLSLSTLKKTDDIEKLARKIRSRLRHN